MNKAEFLSALGEALSPLREQEKQDALSYYDEWIDDSMQDRSCGEEEAVAALASPKDIAAGILEGREKESRVPPVQAGESGGLRTLKARGDDVRHILIRTRNCGVTIRPCEANEVTLRYNEDEYQSYDCTLEDGTLRLELRPQTRFFFGINLFFSRQYSIELCLPRDCAASLDAQSSNAAVEMEQILLWGELRLKTSNARISARMLEARHIDLKTSNASLRLERLKTDGIMTLRTSNGRIEARGLSSRGGISLETSNGRIEAEQIESAASIRLESSNGSLRVSGLAAESISLKTSNSSISGTLPGRAEDYSVLSATSNGKNSLKDHAFAGPRKLSAHTSNAAIKLEFEEQ